MAVIKWLICKRILKKWISIWNLVFVGGWTTNLLKKILLFKMVEDYWEKLLKKLFCKFGILEIVDYEMFINIWKFTIAVTRFADLLLLLLSTSLWDHGYFSDQVFRIILTFKIQNSGQFSKKEEKIINIHWKACIDYVNISLFSTLREKVFNVIYSMARLKLS